MENYELNKPNWSWITSWQKTDCFLGKVLEEAREKNMKFSKDISKDLDIKMILKIVEDPTEIKYDNESYPQFLRSN